MRTAHIDTNKPLVAYLIGKFKNFIPIDTQRFWTKDKMDFKFNTKEFTITRSSSAASALKVKQSANYNKNKVKMRKKSRNDIDCQVSKKNEMYIDCAGDIHPCCWLGSHAYRRKHYSKKWVSKDHEDRHPMFEMRTIRNAIKEKLNNKILIVDNIPSNNLTIVETFVGCGGAHLGFKQNGFRSLLVNDIDKDMIDTLLKNKCIP